RGGRAERLLSQAQTAATSARLRPASAAPVAGIRRERAVRHLLRELRKRRSVRDTATDRRHPARARGGAGQVGSVERSRGQARTSDAAYLACVDVVARSLLTVGSLCARRFT